MQYIEVLRDAIEELDNSFIELRPYEDGDQWFLLVESWDDVDKLNPILERLLSAEGVELGGAKPIDVATDGCWGFSDAYAVCDCCYHIHPLMVNYRSNMEIVNDDERLCWGCINEFPQEYIDTLLKNPVNRANVMLPEKTLTDLGFEKINKESYAAGMYERWDNPKEIYAKLKEQYPNADILFSIVNQNPFETEFDVFVKKEN